MTNFTTVKLKNKIQLPSILLGLLLLILENTSAQPGYIYVHSKTLNEAGSPNITYSLSAGTIPVSNFTLNDEPTQTILIDIGASENGRLWAVGYNNNLYYRNANSATWVSTGVSGVSRVDGGAAGTCFYINTAGTVFSYNGTSTQISSTGQFNNAPWTDIGSGWTNTPTGGSATEPALYVVNDGTTVYKYSGSGTTWNTYTIISNYSAYRIDVNPTNGNVYVGGNNGSAIITIRQITPLATPGVSSLGSVVTTSNSQYRDIAANQNGEVYVTAYDDNNAPKGWYVHKYNSGTSWAKEVGSFDGSGLTGGVGNSLWLTMNSGGWTNGSGWTPAAGPYPFFNIFARGFDGASASYIDDERVRTSPAEGNSQLIPVAPGTYTVTETVPGGWDLQKITVYDPSANSTTDLASHFASINVAANEVVNVVFQTGQLSAKNMLNDCSAGYLEDFGTGPVGSYGSAFDGQTSYHYLASNAPGEDGYYKVVNRANPDFNTWSDAAGIKDHTPGDGDNGYMYAVNAGYEKGEFFRRRFTGIIPGSFYDFSAWIINLTPAASVNPNVTFAVYDHNTQAPLGSYSTGELTNNSVPGTWQQYGFNFAAPTGATDIDLVISNNGIGGNGNDLALDDIRFVLKMPDPVISIVNAACSGTTGSITVASPATAVFEYSIDATNVWQQYPNTTFSNLSLGTHTVYARYIGSANCIVSKTDVIRAAVCGNVYHDANGLTDNTVFGPPTNVLGSLIAVLYDNTSNKVADTVYVLSDGTFTLHAAIGDNYSVYLTSTPTTIGQTAIPTVTLPSGWANTGEKFGTGTGSDGLVNSILSLGTVNASTANANFGIEQRPVTNNQLLNITSNVEAGQIYGFPNLIYLASGLAIPQLSGSDAEDKPASPIDSISTGGTFVITTLPPAAQAILYYDNTPIGAGVVITNYDPAKLQIEFKSGTMTTTFQYALTDAAGMRDLTPATYQINLLGLLPATGLALSAHKVNETLLLKWQTITEDNTVRFNIEQSADGINYNMIGTVKAAGNSNAIQEYSFTHTTPNLAVTYFRVSLVNKDGEISYSNVVRISITSNLELKPNPASSNVVVSGLTGKNSISVYGFDGKLLQVLQATGPLKTIYTGNLIKGAYWIKISQQSRTIKIFKLIRE